MLSKILGVAGVVGSGIVFFLMFGVIGGVIVAILALVLLVLRSSNKGNQ